MQHKSNGSALGARTVDDARGLRSVVLVATFTALTLLALDTAGAQGRGNGNGDGNGKAKGKAAQGIPPGHLPSAGECRVWYDGRPPGQQPSPTSCATARLIASREGGRVIYGAGTRRDGRRLDDGRVDDRRLDDRVYPQTLPEMVWGVVFGRGERQGEVRQWVDGTNLRANYTDADRDGKPEAVIWTDANGVVVQRWLDANRDGRADRVTVYKNKKVAKVFR